MNAFKIMIDKAECKYLYEDITFEDGLKQFQEGGYTAVPVIREDGTYVGTVRDKDFLLKCTNIDGCKPENYRDELCKLTIGDIVEAKWNPAVNISKDINDVLLLSMQQNFVPIVDDRNVFVGIITRRDIIRMLTENKSLSTDGYVVDETSGVVYEDGSDDSGMASLQRRAAEGMSMASGMLPAVNTIQRNEEPYKIFSKMYEAAMKEICIRIETINEMLKIKYNREPLHQIQHRIKSAKSVLGKMARKGLPATVDNIQENLYDIAGVRVICAYLNDVYEFAKYLEIQGDLRVITRKDYIANPKPNGYRSLHLILEVPVNYIGALKKIPVEVQLRTEPMDYWASLEHDLKYKPTHNALGLDISAQLLQCSNELAETERKMQGLSELITKTESQTDEIIY